LIAFNLLAIVISIVLLADDLAYINIEAIIIVINNIAEEIVIGYIIIIFSTDQCINESNLSITFTNSILLYELKIFIISYIKLNLFLIIYYT